MITSAAALLIAALAAAVQQTDTTFAVPAGGRLEVQMLSGSIAVETWDRDEVRVRASHGSRESVRVRMRGPVVRVSTTGGMAGMATVDYDITVPASMDLQLGGMSVDVDVAGTAGRVTANTVSGVVAVRGGRGGVTAQSVSGGVIVEGAEGAIRAHSTSGDVVLRNISGPVEARSVSGDVVLDNIRSTEVAAYTLSGDLYFEGEIAPNGRYTFSTHSGWIIAGISPDVDATLTLASSSGDFTSAFPWREFDEPRRGRRRTLTAGNGSATLEFESFSGDVEIVPPGQAIPRDGIL